MKNLIALLIIVLAFYSCNSESEAKKKEAQEKKATEVYLKNKKVVIDRLKSKYKITYQWDSLNYRFEIDYKPVIKSNYQLIGNFKINNIYEKDSNEYVSIRTGIGYLYHSSYYRTFYFGFPITKEQEKIFRNSNDDIIMVVSIEKVRIKFIPEGDYQINEDESLVLDNSIDYIGKGKIIEIVKINKPKSK